MPAKGYWEKIEAGHYCSRDSRAEIQRKVSRQTYHPDEICWSVIIDGKTEVMHQDTLREAKNEAIRLIEQKNK